MSADRIVFLPRDVFQLRHLDVENREDEIATAKLGFAGQEGFEFKPAIRASNDCRGNDRDEEDGLPDRSLNLLFPELTRGDSPVYPARAERFSASGRVGRATLAGCARAGRKAHPRNLRRPHANS